MVLWWGWDYNLLSFVGWNIVFIFVLLEKEDKYFIMLFCLLDLFWIKVFVNGKGEIFEISVISC